MRSLPGLACGLALFLGATTSATAEADLSLTDIRTKAEAHDPVAMVGYAMLLLDGSVVAYDAGQAAKLIKAAAETGNRQARLMLAVMLDEGLGMATDRERAASLLEDLAESGLPEALYRRAQLTAQSDPEAAMIDLRQAGAQGHVPALQVLATLSNWDELSALSVDEAVDSATATVPQTMAVDVNVIIAIQAMLGQLGYTPGLPTGQQTTETTAAIVLYQAAQGLTADGKATVALRDHIARVLQEGRQ